MKPDDLFLSPLVSVVTQQGEKNIKNPAADQSPRGHIYYDSRDRRRRCPESALVSQVLQFAWLVEEKVYHAHCLHKKAPVKDLCVSVQKRSQAVRKMVRSIKRARETPCVISRHLQLSSVFRGRSKGMPKSSSIETNTFCITAKLTRTS